MQFFFSPLLAVWAAHEAVATPYRVKETHHVPDAWQRLGPSHGGQTIQLQIGLKQARFEELDRHLNEVSDPDHVRYGQHLSADQVNELVAPSSETHELVHAWLRENGVDTDSVGYSAAKDWIIAPLPIAAVEKLLDTQYHNYQHRDGSIIARTTRWSLPRHLHRHIDAIQPTTSFFHVAQQEATYRNEAPQVPASYHTPTNSTLAAACNVTSVTPECFQTLYSTKWYKTQATDKNHVAFANYVGEVPIRSDLKLFLDKYRPEASSQAQDLRQISISNGTVQDGPLTPNQILKSLCREANLDVQAIVGMTGKTPVTSYSTGGESPPFTPDTGTPINTNEPYLAWVNWLLSQSAIPQVISTSYGDSEQTVPRAYAERVCQQFAQVGARGTTLFFSSGDSGVGPADQCISNDGKNTTRYLPSFPASCPYVTTVGATMNFEPEESAYTPARHTSSGFIDFYGSGSGFSNYFDRPAYQEAAVSQYLAALGNRPDDDAGLYNPRGRGYPDLAAQGLYFSFFWNGQQDTISGTSLATPLAASIFSLVNDALLAAGKPALGFLNPWLYKRGYKALTDITNGTSYGCNGQGFPATEGWDAVTGWGTPVFPKLLQEAGVGP